MRDRYNATLEYLFSLEKFGMIFGLDNIRWLLEIIENPQNSLRTVHIAGTNGKGSVATMISDILMLSGYRVGKYTSPHVISFNERITVNDEQISEREVVELTDFMRVKVMDSDPDRSFTFFDFTTALAFEYFRRKKVDIAVVETGLGGRLDSTNVLLPLVSVITNVEYDHMQQLGPTIASIALEKAGIIKHGVPVVSACEGESGQIIEARSEELGCRLYLLDRDFHYRKTADQRLNYSGIRKSLTDVFVRLYGDHQLKNAAVALCTAEVLLSHGFSLPDACCTEALANVTWPGRLEKIHDDPLIIADAAHNVHGMNALAEFMRTHFTDKRKILVFGVMRDKEYTTMLDEIAPQMDSVILTKPSIERALSSKDMKAHVKDAVATESVREAMKQAKNLARSEDLILITGSFYTVGEAKTAVDEIF